jgi:hypothetical protein
MCVGLRTCEEGGCSERDAPQRVAARISKKCHAAAIGRSCQRCGRVHQRAHAHAISQPRRGGGAARHRGHAPALRVHACE